MFAMVVSLVFGVSVKKVRCLMYAALVFGCGKKKKRVLVELFVLCLRW